MVFHTRCLAVDNFGIPPISPQVGSLILPLLSSLKLFLCGRRPDKPMADWHRFRHELFSLQQNMWYNLHTKSLRGQSRSRYLAGKYFVCAQLWFLCLSLLYCSLMRALVHLLNKSCASPVWGFARTGPNFRKSFSSISSCFLLWIFPYSNHKCIYIFKFSACNHTNIEFKKEAADMQE